MAERYLCIDEHSLLCEASQLTFKRAGILKVKQIVSNELVDNLCMVE